MEMFPAGRKKSMLGARSVDIVSLVKSAESYREKIVRRDRVLAVSMTLLVLVALWAPGDRIPATDSHWWAPPPGSDKLVHAGLFFAEAYFLYRALRWSPLFAGLFYPVVFTAALAVITEAGQHLVPERSVDPRDLLANFAGIVLFLLVRAAPLRSPTAASGETETPPES